MHRIHLTLVEKMLSPLACGVKGGGAGAKKADTTSQLAPPFCYTLTKSSFREVASMKLFVRVLVFFLAVSSAAWPQTSTSEITGVVNDSSGARIPGADVTLTN